MIELRQGQYGTYYGSLWGTSETISTEQAQHNAQYLYRAFSDKGWTLNAISGMLGCLEGESGLNPGRWQSNNVGVGPAYGLVQWDPYSKYINWAQGEGLDPSEMDSNIARILYELDNGIQYDSRYTAYPETFYEFTQSTKTPYYLACAWAWNYERSGRTTGTAAQQEELRQEIGARANKWYEYLSGNTPPVDPDPDEPEVPDDPDQPTTKRQRMSLLLLIAASRRRF